MTDPTMSNRDPASEAADRGAQASKPVTHLDSTSTGRWLVTTNSTHLFDLDAFTYVRVAGDSRAGFAHDGQPVPLSRIDRWPAVGATFFIWFDDVRVPELYEHWRKSSTIRSIRPAD